MRVILIMNEAGKVIGNFEIKLLIENYHTK